MKPYKKRVADDILARKLQTAGAVLVEGAKWCGKTTTAEQSAKSTVYVDDPKLRAEVVAKADIDPSFLLQGATPHLIDEWQLVPQVWDAVRFEVDHREDGFGQFILTGSSVPVSQDKFHHSGTGRFTRLQMRTMSLYESEDSSGEVSLASLFSQETIGGTNRLDFARLAFLVCRGGWPNATNLPDDLSLDVAYNYHQSVVENDISRADNVARDKSNVKRLLQACARGQATQTTLQNICRDMTANDTSITTATIASYLSALKKIFVIDDVAAWNPNLRSRTAIRTSDTHYFVDPSIAVAALQTGPEELMKTENLNLFGQLFEALCIRDLKVYAESLGGEVRHYRDKNGLECNAVIHIRNGEYGLAEIKLGGSTKIEEGAATLKKLRDKLDTDRMSEPAFLAVITGTEPFAYRRKDGVYVVPIGCLKN